MEAYVYFGDLRNTKRMRRNPPIATIGGVCVLSDTDRQCGAMAKAGTPTAGGVCVGGGWVGVLGNFRLVPRANAPGEGYQ